MKVSFHTLGCRLNQSESAILAQSFLDAGYRVVPDSSPADVCVVNTCTVTGVSDAKCRNSIRRLIKTNPQARVAVIGCYAESGFKQLGAIEGVDVIVGNQEKLNLLKYLPEQKKERAILVKDRIVREEFSIETIGQATNRSRTSLKIQDGCDFMCSFCIIPYVRGRSKSRNFMNLLSEARRLKEKGFRELVLTGVNLGTFKTRDHSFLDVVDALNEMRFERIRISSIEPTTIDDGVLLRMADPDHSLVPYLHLPLQSGSDRVLKWMGRRYTSQEYIAYLNHARKMVPDLSVGTDILTGTPPESEEDFNLTCELLNEQDIMYAHAFTYSEREGTPAEKEKQVPYEVRKQRTRKILEISRRKKMEVAGRYLGKTMPVLFEEKAEGFWQGRTENYMLVKYRSHENLENIILPVTIEEVCGDWVRGGSCEIVCSESHVV